MSRNDTETAMNTPFSRKIGILQNAPLPADLSGNIRRIVQGYRECIDHGAELVIAPATALCGADLHDLAMRPSFIRQQMAALETLSRELGEAPLLLGAYAPIIGNADDYWDGENCISAYPDEDPSNSNGHEMPVSLVPYLLEHDCVSELADSEVSEINELQIYIDTDDEEVFPSALTFDLMVHLGTKPWYAEAAPTDAAERLWEASANGVPVICMHHVGTTEENLYGGGSGIYMPDNRTLLRLPFFQESAKVVNLNAKGRAAALPEEVELLGMALTRGIRDTVENNGYRGICLSLDDQNSTLLAVLSVHAMGASKVTGVSFSNNAAVAEALGIKYHNIDLSDTISHIGTALGSAADAATVARLKGNLLCTIAEEKGQMLLTSLDRQQLMTGSFTLYGETCGFLAPLGNLYEIDIHMLSKYFSEQHAEVFGSLEEPTALDKGRIIHELADLNTSPSSLLSHAGYLFKENDVRQIQRRIIASALKRSQFPITLHVDKPEQRLVFPIYHRLND